MEQTRKEEEWKQIEGFEAYEVSDLGRIRHAYRGNLAIVKQGVSTPGYWLTCLFKDKKQYTKTTHRLVMMAFRPIEDPKKFQVNHINGVITDNRLVNLEWCTPKENMRHCFKNGLKKSVKVNETIVRDIRSKRLGRDEFASLYSLSKANVGAIERKTTWKHVI